VTETSHGVVRARDMVVATEPFHRRYVPAAAAGLSPDVCQLHSYATARRRTSPPQTCSSWGTDDDRIAT